MAGDYLFNFPSNRIVMGDYLGARQVKIGPNATAAQMVPGRLVKYDTSGNADIKECAVIDPSNNIVPIGVLGYEDTLPANRSASITTAQAVGDIVAVHMAPGMIFHGWLIDAQTVVVGSYLKPSTSGSHAVITANTDWATAKSLEAKTSSGVTACWMQYLG